MLQKIDLTVSRGHSEILRRIWLQDKRAAASSWCNITRIPLQEFPKVSAIVILSENGKKYYFDLSGI